MVKVMTVSTNDFIPNEETGMYEATFAAADIGFSNSRYYRVSKFLRNVSGVYKNIILSYEINSSGDLTIYSDMEMTGRMVLETDN